MMYIADYLMNRRVYSGRHMVRACLLYAFSE